MWIDNLDKSIIDFSDPKLTFLASRIRAELTMTRIINNIIKTMDNSMQKTNSM